MTDKPRLIEVAFPLKQASLTSVHEKNVRHGHISTLHTWPARRPLTPAPAGACILYANACGKDETELKVVWNILEQGGKSGPGKKGRPRKDAEEGEAEEAAEESSGNEYRL